MLAVASVTANIRARANVQAQFGLSRTNREDYDGNLVPLSTGIAYEENPTISYVPLGGERFTQQLITPLSLGELILLTQTSGRRSEVFVDIALRSINGVENPRVARDAEGSPEWDRLVELWMSLMKAGCARSGATSDGGYAVYFRSEGADDLRMLEELLDITGIDERPTNGRLVIPMRLGLEGLTEGGLNFDTLSPIEILRLAGASIEIPESHLTSGVLVPRVDPYGGDFLRIRTSRSRPRGAGTIAIRYRGYWYYIDDRDPTSKRSFKFLRVLVGLRLYEGGKELSKPVLTIPVG
jgi:hypothetical protein